MGLVVERRSKESGYRRSVGRDKIKLERDSRKLSGGETRRDETREGLIAGNVAYREIYPPVSRARVRRIGTDGPRTFARFTSRLLCAKAIGNEACRSGCS